MLIAMAFPAMAAETGSIKITVNGNSTDLSEKKFVLYRVLNATVDGDAVSYTVNDAYKAALESAIKKAENNANYDFSDRDTIYDYIAALISGEGESPEQKAEKESKLRLFADKLKGELQNYDGVEYSLDASNATIEGESFLISGLDYGYYAVVESTDLGSDDDGAISLTMLNSVTPNSEIDIKSDYPTIEKKVKENSTSNLLDIADYKVGDAIEFTLTSAVPDMAGYTTYTFNFHDTLSQGLSYVSDSVKVYIGNQEYTKDSEYKSGVKVFTVDVKDQSLSINLADLVELKNVLNGQGTNVSKGTPIVVTYTAKLNENAVIGQEGNTNKAYIEYSNNPYEDSKGTTLEDKVSVYTYQLDVEKTNEGGTKKLAGAEFELYRTNNGGTLTDIVNFSKVVEEGKNEYIVDPDGSPVITSDDKVNIILKGLDAGTYYLEETKAPEGYNKLKKPVKVTITPTYKDDALISLSGSIEGEWDSETATVTGDFTSGKISFRVENSSGVKLPETGGFGTTIFYLAGFVIMAGAVTAFFYTRRKDNK